MNLVDWFSKKDIRLPRLQRRPTKPGMQVHSKSSSPLPICVQVAPLSHGFGSQGSTPPISQKSPLNPSGQKHIGGAGSFEGFSRRKLRNVKQIEIHIYLVGNLS